MRKINIILYLSVIILISCSTSYSYDVRVANHTGHSIKVEFKSKYDKEESIESFVILEDGQSKLIIQSREFDRHTSEVCDSVAVYVRAIDLSTNRIGGPEWCSDQIALEWVDIGEYQYMINLMPEHFE